jgi:hypothetical protein
MPIDDVLDMSYTEMQVWQGYFERRPYGWREDDRAFKSISPHLSKPMKPESMFPSLKSIYEPEKDQAGPKGLSGSFLMHKMMGAVGGDSIQ